MNIENTKLIESLIENVSPTRDHLMNNIIQMAKGFHVEFDIRHTGWDRNLPGAFDLILKSPTNEVEITIPHDNGADLSFKVRDPGQSSRPPGYVFHGLGILYRFLEVNTLFSTILKKAIPLGWEPQCVLPEQCIMLLDKGAYRVDIRWEYSEPHFKYAIEGNTFEQRFQTKPLASLLRDLARIH